MKVDIDRASLIADLFHGIRTADRIDTGRRLLVLVALGFLSRPGEARQNWHSLQNAAANDNDRAQLRATLIKLSSVFERGQDPLDKHLTKTLTDEVLNAGDLGSLITRAATVVDRLLASHTSETSFASWFDIALDAAADSGPLSMENATPRPIAELMVELAEVPPSATVFDPSCGQGTLLSVTHEMMPDVSLYGQELNIAAEAMAALRLALFGATATFWTGDSLRGNTPVYKGTIPRFDRVLCDPPLGRRFDQSTSIKHRGAFSELNLKYSDSLFVDLAASLLKPDGKAAILVTTSFLSRKGPEELLRKQLLDLNYIEGVVELPQGASTWSSVRLAILVLRKPAIRSPHKPVIVVDGSDLKLSGRRPGARLLEEHIQELVKRYRYHNSPHARTVEQTEIDDTGNLEVGRYFSQPSAGLDLSSTLATISDLKLKASDAEMRMDKTLSLIMHQKQNF